VAAIAISNDVQKIALGCTDGTIAVAGICDAVASYKFVRRHDGASLGCSRCVVENAHESHSALIFVQQCEFCLR
jgi:hypothetical protein